MKSTDGNLLPLLLKNRKSEDHNCRMSPELARVTGKEMCSILEKNRFVPKRANISGMLT